METKLLERENVLDMRTFESMHDEEEEILIPNPIIWNKVERRKGSCNSKRSQIVLSTQNKFLDVTMCWYKTTGTTMFVANKGGLQAFEVHKRNSYISKWSKITCL